MTAPLTAATRGTLAINTKTFLCWAILEMVPESMCLCDVMRRMAPLQEDKGCPTRGTRPHLNTLLSSLPSRM
jgi:hypothetical protein